MGTLKIAYFRATCAGVTKGNDFLKGGHERRVRMVGAVVKYFLASKFRREWANCKGDVGL